jgi:hypothetical protein
MIFRVAALNFAPSRVSRRQYDQAARYLSAGLAYCEERDLDHIRPYMLAYRARMNFEKGRWLEASEDAEEALRHPRASSVARIPALRTLGHLRIRPAHARRGRHKALGNRDIDVPILCGRLAHFINQG